MLLGGENDHHENIAATTDESVTPEPVYEPPQKTHRNYTSEEGSKVPIMEPTESNTPPTDKAKFVMNVIKAPFKQLHKPVVYPSMAETKVLNCLLPNHGMGSLLLV